MIKQYWYLWLAVGILTVITAAVIVMASRAVSSHNAMIKKQLEQLKRLKLLKDKYKGFDKELLEKAEPAEALEGTMAVLQSRIEKADNAEAEFEKFTDAQKNVYTLNYFLEDVEAQGLSYFFRNNGDELRLSAAQALKAVGYDSAVPPVSALSLMFDGNNEDVSVDADEMSKIDGQFSSTFDKQALLLRIKEYIVDNADNLRSQD